MDARDMKVTGGLDAILEHLNGHDCPSPLERHHSVTHLIKGTSAQIESTMQKVSLACVTTDCICTLLEDSPGEGPERTGEILVVGNIGNLRAYVRLMKDLICAR